MRCKRLVQLGLLLAVAFFPLPGSQKGVLQLGGVSTAHAEAAPGAEKAFDAAKELGTIDAWQAFLANYPTGFHADLARAYLKKLQDNAPPSLSTSSSLTEFPTPAGSWGGIVRDGEGQQYKQVAILPEGTPVSLMGKTETLDNGYPWFKIWFGTDQRKGYMWGGILCSTGAERPDLYKTCSAKVTPPQPVQASPVVAPKAAQPVPIRCAAGYIAINGRCVLKRNAATHCGPGFHAQGGTCVPGYVAPKKLSTDQVKGLAKGCPKGQVWSKAEGCHEDD